MKKPVWQKRSERIKEILGMVDTFLLAANFCTKEDRFPDNWEQLTGYIKSLEDYLDRTQDDATYGTGGWRQYALEK